jgi:hypothetical protein
MKGMGLTLYCYWMLQMYWRGGNSSLWDEARERQLQDTIQAASAAIAQANADMGVYLAMGIRFYQEIVNKLQVCGAKYGGHIGYGFTHSLEAMTTLGNWSSASEKRIVSAA